MGAHLGFGLFAGAEQTHNLGIFAGEIFACNRAGSTDAHGRYVMVVHKRQNFASIHVEEHDETDKITGINPPLAASDLDFFGKAGIDPQRHGLHARHQPHDIVEIVLPALFFPGRSQPRPRRIHRLALAQFLEGLLDGGDFLGHRQQIFHLFVLEDENHGALSF